MNNLNSKGFTLIEILVVIGLIAILATVVLIAINPARQFAQGRDSQRISNLNSILNAIGQRIADGKGTFNGSFTVNGIYYNCPNLAAYPATTTIVTSGGGQGDLSCLIPTYIPSFPFDPTNGTPSSTGYSYYQESNGRVHVFATTTEPTITRITPLEVVR